VATFFVALMVKYSRRNKMKNTVNFTKTSKMTTNFTSLLNKDVVVLFDDVRQCANFIKKVKDANGKWINGKPILERDYHPTKMRFFFALRITPTLEIGFVSASQLTRTKLQKIQYKEVA